MSLAKYDKYKDSGVDWLDELPEHWNYSRIKSIGSVNGRVGWKALKASEYVDSGYFFLATPNIKERHIDYINVNYITYERFIESPEIILLEDDILLTKDGSTLGTVNIVKKLPGSGTVNSSIAVLRFKKIVNNDYVFFLIVSDYIQNLICQKKDGMGVPHLFQKDINNFLLLVPPISEQTTIANYLDRKITVIDRKVSLLEQKITHYQQLRKSLINETVCRGLDKSVKLKDSGIEWIGKIPDHWEVKRLKDKYYLFTGNSISDKSMFEDKNNSFDYVSTKDIDVETGLIEYDNGVYIPKNDKSFKIAKANSILLCLEGGSAGKKVGFNIKDICFVNKLCSIKGKTRNVNEKYQFYCIQSPIFERQFFAILNGLIGGVSLNLVKFFNILYPPIQEQNDIVIYLDEKTQKIDTIVSNIKSQIATLKELRKTLINDVVTGKIKVSG